jgi:hypothetical protein
MVSVIFLASGSATASITTENAPACAIALASFSIGSQSFLLAALGAERAERVDRLRRQPDVTHHGNSALDKNAMVSAIRAPPSSFTAPQ